MARPSDAELAERVRDMRAWANSRIMHCRRDESRLGLEGAVDAARERMTLTAVLEQLGFQPPPAEELRPGRAVDMRRQARGHDRG